ncbi:hypothetical protein ACFE04_030440 [Oxalis oulophora]
MCFPKLALILLSLILFSLPSAFAIKKSYVVYLGSHVPGAQHPDQIVESHYQLLGSVLGSGKQLHTTHSWQFMKQEYDNGVVIPNSLWKKANYGAGVIIGNLDTGVWPESKSFSDDGFGPVPESWKGGCENDTAKAVPCNRKLIGAKFFLDGYEAYAGTQPADKRCARDHEGHGTHTLSTAGGNFVAGANVFGLGNGTAKGGSPLARVAAYKVCWPPIDSNECFDVDIMNGFEEAIKDRVNVLSVSLGGTTGEDYMADSVAIGSFHAVKNGVVVVASAGNSGPQAQTVTNVAPWLITVAASTIDREFNSYVELQDGQRLKGESLSDTSLPIATFYPIMSSEQAKADNATADDAKLCLPGTLDPKMAKGKIIVCLRGQNARVDKGRQAQLAGAVGMILCNSKKDGNEVVADAHIFPATHLNYKDGQSLYAYINSTSEPLGFITTPVTNLNTTPAGFMAAFSSAGPNVITPEILKPDITAPGVNIVAAYSEATGPVDAPYDTRRIPFNSESGTSMSCPHVAGVVGLLRAVHPKWSPAAIKSAILTSAMTRDNTKHPMLDGSFVKATPFQYGHGHIRPNRAMHPGLVYDLSVNDYLDFLCGLGYNQTLIQTFNEGPYECPKKFNIMDFNYPSITVPNLSGTVTATRKLKNVGSPGTYTVKIRQPAGISVSVEPKSLKFDKVGEEKSFKVTMKAKHPNAAKGGYVFGSMRWTDGKHYVRSPITVSAAVA